jgi:hypothetical protein
MITEKVWYRDYQMQDNDARLHVAVSALCNLLQLQPPPPPPPPPHPWLGSGVVFFE